MATDAKGLTQSLEGKKLRLFFQGGEICDVILVSVNVHESCPFCDGYADFFYDVISTNRPDKYKGDEKKVPKPCYAAEFAFLDRWENLEAIGGH
jgi:hypothetical protein